MVAKSQDNTVAEECGQFVVWLHISRVFKGLANFEYTELSKPLKVIKLKILRKFIP